MDSLLNLSESLNLLLKSNMLYTNKQNEWATKFNRHSILDVQNRLDGAKEYLFFTKPDLNLFTTGSAYMLNEDIARNTIISDIFRIHPQMLRQLSMVDGQGPFMTVLSNAVLNTLDMPSITSKTIDSSTNVFGDKITYKKHSFESDYGHSFTLEFEDTKRLEVYSIFKALDEYIRMKSIGLCKPKTAYRGRVLDDQISIFKIVVTADRRTILFFAKATGVYPTGAPREAFSEIGDKITYNISFNCHWVEDMDPVIISEFNALSNLVAPSNEIPLYDQDNHIIDTRWANTPYIKYIPRKSIYELHWR